VVPPPGPGSLVGSGQQGFELGTGQVADLGLLAALGRDGQDAGDEAGVLGVAERGVAEE
jgi:hypothetical protein